MLENVQRILIIKLRAIGDVVMATPVPRLLRAVFPQAQIDFLTEPGSRLVLEGNPNVDRVVIYERGASDPPNARKGPLAGARFLWELRSRNYDLVFDLFGNPRSAVFTWATGAKQRVGFDFRFRRCAYNVVVPSRADRIHEVEFNLDALRAVGISVENPKLEFVLTEKEHLYAEQFFRENGLIDQPVVGLNPSGGWPAKRWPVEKFAALASRIQREIEARVLLLWGPGEREQVLRLRLMIDGKVLLAPRTDLKQLGAILSRLDLLVTNDSAPMHISAAVGTPVVAIFGPTNPELQGPYGEGHVVVQNETLDCLGCNRLECKHTSCMKGLAVERVYEAVSERLQSVPKERLQATDKSCEA